MATPSNKSVIKSFKLLTTLRQFGRAASLVEIAKAANLSVATAHRFAITLEAVGALRTDAEGRYLLGPSLVALGEQAMRHAEATNALQRLVDVIAQSLQKTVHVGMRSGTMVRYVAKADGPNRRLDATRVGAELEAYCTAVGKVLLAHSGLGIVDRCLRWGALVGLTRNTITTRERLVTELEQVRSCGVAVDNEEFLEGLRCVAVPIIGPQGTVVASLSASCCSPQTSPRYSVPHLAGQLRHYSNFIGCRMTPEDWASI